MSNTLEFARFVATKFQSNLDGWTYTRDRGTLEYIRFTEDYTGYNHWTKRLKRGLDVRHSFRRGGLSAFLRPDNAGLLYKIRDAYSWFKVSMRKDKHLPDGIINGNPVFWEEDGEYQVLFGPTVGVKVLDFLEAEPDHPHAVAILAEMERMSEKSWPKNS